VCLVAEERDGGRVEDGVIGDPQAQDSHRGPKDVLRLHRSRVMMRLTSSFNLDSMDPPPLVLAIDNSES